MRARLMTGYGSVMAVLLLTAGNVAAEPAFARGQIGWTTIDEQNVPVDEESGAPVSGTVDETLWYGSFAAQKPWHKGFLELGYEMGAGLGWTSPDTAYVITGDGGVTARVAVKSDLLIFQTSGGIYGALNMGRHLRFSVSAGPAFVYGSQSSDPVERTITVNGQPLTVKVGGKDQDATLAAYAHADLHIQVADDVWIGIGAGRMTGELDFSDTIGEIPLDQTVFSLSMAAPMDI